MVSLSTVWHQIKSLPNRQQFTVPCQRQANVMVFKNSVHHWISLEGLLTKNVKLRPSGDKNNNNNFPSLPIFPVFLMFIFSPSSLKRVINSLNIFSSPTDLILLYSLYFILLPSNIIKSPIDEKYRRVKTQNKSFSSKVWCLPEAQQFLHHWGWIEVCCRQWIL